MATQKLKPGGRGAKTLPQKATLPPRVGAIDVESHRWTFLTNHAHVLILLSQDPTRVLREVAAQVGITERAVQRIIVDLEVEGFIERERVGRQNQYRILTCQALRHPVESHCTIGDLIALVGCGSPTNPSPTKLGVKKLTHTFTPTAGKSPPKSRVRSST